MRRSRRLEGQVSIVTGASSGIGRAIAKHLAASGATVVVAARRADRLQSLVDEIRHSSNSEAVSIPTDLFQESDRLELINTARALTGSIDILINNAGYGQPGAIEEVSQERLRAQFEINFFAAVHLMHLVIPVMRERGTGRIINVTGTVGRFAVPGLGAESSSKAALEAISDATRVELRPFGIHVSVIQPGVVKTETWDVGTRLGDDLMNAVTPYSSLYQALMKVADRGRQSGADPNTIAKVALHAAASKRPRSRYAVPIDGRMIVAASHLPAFVRDPLIRLALGI